MDLSRAIGKFAQNPIEGQNRSNWQWEDTGLKGGLKVYDRFISERSFGQKKRILTMYRDTRLPTDTYWHYRIGSDFAIFTVEGYNQDVEKGAVYDGIYMMRETPFFAEVVKDVYSSTRASGIGGTPVETVVEATFVDYERYSALNSRELNDVDYTVVDIFFPKGAKVDTDCRVRILGRIYEVQEIRFSLELKVARARLIDFYEYDFDDTYMGSYSGAYGGSYG